MILEIIEFGANISVEGETGKGNVVWQGREEGGSAILPGH
jgi:hypothetical protein